MSWSLPAELVAVCWRCAQATAQSKVFKHLMPYMRSRTRCQIWLGRPLRANDNLMQLCIHGGTLKYGEGGEGKPEDVEGRVDDEALEAAAAAAARNPMA